MELPKGCFLHLNHKKILCKDIHNDRPGDQGNIHTERALAHRRTVEKHTRLIGRNYWAVFSTTTYEMSGNYYAPYMGGRAWAETDLTGLEWRFDNEVDANNFAREER